MILKYVRNHLPYLLLIAIYFFFINLEARNDNNNQNAEKGKLSLDDKTDSDYKNLRIKIPVIPFNQ